MKFLRIGFDRAGQIAQVASRWVAPEMHRRFDLHHRSRSRSDCQPTVFRSFATEDLAGYRETVSHRGGMGRPKEEWASGAIGVFLHRIGSIAKAVRVPGTEEDQRPIPQGRLARVSSPHHPPSPIPNHLMGTGHALTRSFEAQVRVAVD